MTLTGDPPTMVISDGAEPRSLLLRKARLAVLSGDRKGEEFIMDRPVFSLGAGAGNDLVLPDRFLSRSHCEIANTAAGYILRDLDSTNGTFLQGVRIREAFLSSGAEIALGRTRLSFAPLTETRRIDLSRAHRFGEVLGKSVPMRRIFRLLETYGPTDTPILIEGETGTGKEVLAESIHRNSPRRRRPFAIIDCGALSSSLVESELFGHGQGAFTGAKADRIGAFEQAGGGTVFLDEIGELSPELQPKLLRVLENKEIRRVGTNAFRRVDVRIIAATNTRLETAINKGRFREDLFYRLAMLKIEIPPLRERREDLPILIDRFVEMYAPEPAERERLRARMADATVRAYIERHAWPGNVRELRNFINMAALAGPEQSSADLPSLSGSPVPGRSGDGAGIPIDPDRPFKEAKAVLVGKFESGYIAALLDRHHWNVSRAARAAGIERAYLQRLIRKYGRQRPGTDSGAAE